MIITNYSCMHLTLTKPHLIRTPHPTSVIPLHSLGNNIPVAGSFDGESMTGSPPSGTPTEHCTVVGARSVMLLPVTYRYVAVAAAPVMRSDDKAGDVDVLACEICLTRFPFCVARDIRAAALTVERG